MPPSDFNARAADLRSRATTAPSEVSVEKLVELLLVTDTRARTAAVEATVVLADERPTAVEGVSDRLTALLDGDADERGRAALALRMLADERSESFVDAVPPLRSLAAETGAPGRDDAVLALAVFAETNPAAVAPAIPNLTDIAQRAPPTAVRGGPESRGEPSPERTRYETVRGSAVLALSRVAARRPETFAETVPVIADLLSDDDSLIRAEACTILESLAASHPDQVEPLAPTLADLVVADPKHPVPWRAADALNALGEHRPVAVADALAPEASRLASLLDDSDPGIRGVGAGLFAYVAEHHPAAADDEADRLAALLDDDSAPVRASAALALGLASVEAVRERLEALATDDPDSDVRTLSAAGLERFDD